jgi:hypothetical protein
VASLLLLDVLGAFDHVSHQRLLHNLRKRRIDKKMTSWIASFLQNRSTTIQLRELTTEPLLVDTGIPQGSPISPILYLFYNADLLEIGARNNPERTAGRWIDDVYFLTHGKSTRQNCLTLATMHREAERWSRTHGSRFDLAKYQLVHFTRTPKMHNMKEPLRLNDTTIEPSAAARYLGIMMDSSLRWIAHVQHVLAKASSALCALGSLARSTWGTNLIGLRQIYQAVLIPQITYGCLVWYTPQGEPGHKKEILRKLSSVQLQAARIIAGAYRATSRLALDIELFLLPMRFRLEKRAHETALNIRTSLMYKSLEDIYNRPISMQRPRSRHYMTYCSPLMNLANSRKRKIGTAAHDNLESRDPFVTEAWWTPPRVTILGTREEAERMHKEIISRLEHLLAMYTDGSGINEKVGAAAVAPTLGIRESAFMGKQNSTTVYAAELFGILMALTIITRSSPQTAAIFTDNQAALWSLSKPARQLGLFIIKKIIRALETLRSRGIEVELY